MSQINWPNLFQQGRARTPKGPAFDENDWKLIKSKNKTVIDLQKEYSGEKEETVIQDVDSGEKKKLIKKANS